MHNYEQTESLPTDISATTKQKAEAESSTRNTISPNAPLPALKDSEYFSFSENCRYYRCTTFAVKNSVGNIVYPEHTGPKGYSILPTNIGSKDDILVTADVTLGDIHEGDVYTYNIHTFNIAPFMMKKENKQFHLENTEGLYSIPSFDKKHKHLLITFNYETVEDSCTTCDYITNNHFVRTYTYDDEKNQLQYISITEPGLLFEGKDLGSIIYSNRLYSSEFQTITAWMHKNKAVRREDDELGEDHRGPVVLYDIQSKKYTTLLSASILLEGEDAVKKLIQTEYKRNKL